MSRRHLLDTNLISNFFFKPRAKERFPQQVAWVEERIREEKQLALSTFTLYEIERWFRRDHEGPALRKKLLELELLKHRITVLPLDARGRLIWKMAASFWAKAKRHKPALAISDADLLIFSTAMSQGYVLATTDQKLVKSLEKLDLGEHVELLPLA